MRVANLFLRMIGQRIFQTLGEFQMIISKMLANVVKYISEAAMRIFAPTGDSYPAIGVQPFTGDPYKPGLAKNW